MDIKVGMDRGGLTTTNNTMGLHGRYLHISDTIGGRYLIDE